MRKELIQLSVAVSIIAISVLGCSSRAPVIKPTEVIPVPTVVSPVAVLGDNDPIVRAYSDDLRQQPVYELQTNSNIGVVNLSPRVTVYPGVVRGVMDYFSELADREALKGKQRFISINGQPVTFTARPQRENTNPTIVVLSNNVVPPQSFRTDIDKYPNAFFLHDNGKLFIFVYGETDGDQDSYAQIDRELFPGSNDRINNSLYKTLCNIKVIIEGINKSSLSAAQQNIPYQRFIDWARSLSVKKLLGVQDSIIPTEVEYSRIPKIFGNVIVPIKR